MKKSLITLTLLVSFLAYQASAQVRSGSGSVLPRVPQTQTITVSGSPASQPGTPGGTVDFNIKMSLSAALPTNTTSLGLLLATPNAGASFFHVFFLSGSAEFPTANSLSSSSNQSAFATTGVGPNAGMMVSNPSLDLGSNAGGGAGHLWTDTSAFSIDNVRIVIASNTPAGTYNFFASLGWPTADPDGSFVNDASNDGPDSGGTFHVTNATAFSITIVPEPATWSLLGLGGLGSLGLTYLRARRRS